MKRGLLLPGYACRSWIWDQVIDTLEPRYDVKAIDWPRELTPSFHTVAHFAEWVIENEMNSGSSYDFIVGHSMGGLVTAHIASMKPIEVEAIALVESFITPPSTFFQNLLTEDASDELVERVLDMLRLEQIHYSDSLKNELQTNINLCDLVTQLECKVYGIYGDRECNNHDEVVSKLQLPNAVAQQMGVEVIRNSCHFPMLESPCELGDCLRAVLG